MITGGGDTSSRRHRFLVQRPSRSALIRARLSCGDRPAQAVRHRAKIAGAVAAVARHGKVAYLEAVGVQDLQTRAPMTERSLFRIYSMTKSVTAVAVMMLHEQGRFALTDPVAKFLPEFRGGRGSGGVGRSDAKAGA